MTPKQTRFVAEYLANGLNATKDAISAGYSEKTADTQGARLLVNVKVAQVIEARTSKIMERLDVTSDMVVQEIAKLAFFDPRKLFNDDGSMKLISEIDDHSAVALAGFDVCELFDGTGDQKHVYGLLKKVKLADKSRDLEVLGRYFKLFSPDKEGLEVERVTTIIVDI